MLSLEAQVYLTCMGLQTYPISEWCWLTLHCTPSFALYPYPLPPPFPSPLLLFLHFLMFPFSSFFSFPCLHFSQRLLISHPFDKLKTDHGYPCLRSDKNIPMAPFYNIRFGLTADPCRVQFTQTWQPQLRLYPAWYKTSLLEEAIIIKGVDVPHVQV